MAGGVSDRLGRGWFIALGVSAFSFALAGVALADTIDCYGGGSTCYGTSGDDVIYGTGSRDYIYTRSGSDRPVYGYGDTDFIHGEYGYDTLWGGTDNDNLYGDENGTSSWDRLIGQPGPDNIYDRWVTDHFIEADAACGQDGDDYIDIKDGTETEDYWYGGGGNDEVIKNAVDTHVSNDVCNGPAT